MQTYPIRNSRRSVSLDGAWRFAFVQDSATPLDQMTPPDDYPELQPVPGVFDTGAAPNHGRRSVGFYRRDLELDLTGRLLLRVGAVGLAATFWLDGVRVGATRLPYSTFELELPPLDASLARHTIVVAVDNRFTPQATPIFSPFFDFYGYGGIYRSLTLEELPSNGHAIDRVHVATRDLETGRVSLRCLLRDRGFSGHLPLTFAFDHGLATSVEADFRDGVATLDAHVPGFRLWSPDCPALHTVRVAVDGDVITERFGIRDVRTEGERILLNGQPVRLLGACRHEAHVAYGPALPVNQMLEDLHLLKAMGANFVRCVHYPQDQQFLDLCDEIGILAWQESLGWGNGEQTAADPDFQALQVEQTRLMVHNSLNHPAVIIWAFMNECCSDKEAARPLYEAQVRTIKSFGPELLVSYASCRLRIGEDGLLADRCFDLCDVVSFNTYPGWMGDGTWTETSSERIPDAFRRLAEAADRHPGSHGKPLLMSENGCCAIYGIHDPGLAQWSEEYQADYVATAVRTLLDLPRFCGFSIWQFIDSRSYVNAAPGVRCKPKGMNYAGLVDEHRRPKLAYHAVAQLYRQATTH